MCSHWPLEAFSCWASPESPRLRYPLYSDSPEMRNFLGTHVNIVVMEDPGEIVPVPNSHDVDDQSLLPCTGRSSYSVDVFLALFSLLSFGMS